MKEYTFYWLTGKKEVHKGTDPANALTLAGYSNGALRALDFWEEGQSGKYEWQNGRWINKDLGL